MNIFMSIITFLALCGLCTSQKQGVGPDVGPDVVEQELATVDNPNFCKSEKYTKLEYDHSVILVLDIETALSVYSSLTDVASSTVSASNPSVALIKRVTDYLNTVKDYQSFWLESLKYITYVSEIIYYDNSIPLCPEIFEETRGWREINYFVEKVMNWSSETYDKLYDCVITDDLNCSFDGKSFVLNEIQTIEYADDVIAFRELYPQLLTIHNKARQQYTLFYFMILWFRTIDYSFFGFDDDTTVWLAGGLRLIDADTRGIRHEIIDTLEDIDKISSLIEGVNTRQNDLRELMDYLQTLKSRIPQMDQLSTFLDSQLTELRRYSGPLWADEFADFTVWTVGPDGHEIPTEYTLHESISSSLRSTHTAIATVDSIFSSNLSSPYDTLDTALVSCIKSLDELFYEFNVDLAYCLQCVKKTLDAMRYASVMKIRRHQLQIATGDIGAIFDVVNPHYTDFLTSVSQFLIKLSEDRDSFLDYLDTSTNPIVPFFTGQVPSTDDMTAYSNFLDRFSYTLKQFLDTQCKTHQSAYYSELVLQYNGRLNGPQFSMFVGETLVDDLREFLNLMNDYYTEDKIGGFNGMFDEIVAIYDEAREAFHNHDPLETRATKMTNLTDRLKSQKDGFSDMATSGNRFSEVATYTGIITMIVLMDSFQDPGLLLNEYGTFIRTVRSPLLQRSDMNQTTKGMVGGTLFEEIIQYPAGLTLIRNASEDVRAYSTQFEEFRIHKLGDSAYLFATPFCPDHCTFSFYFKDLVEARVAAGCFVDGIGKYTEVEHNVTVDHLPVLITQSDGSRTIEISFLSSFDRVYSSRYTFASQCRIQIAVTGPLTFTYEKVTAAIVNKPTLLAETPWYNVYNAEAAAEFLTTFHVAKGVYLEEDFSGWSSLTQSADFLTNGGCRGLGVVREKMNKYGKVELKGIIYDGSYVVYNPDSACHEFERMKNKKKKASDVDNADDGTDVEDEVLYMYYRATQIQDSNQFQITLKLFSNKMRKGFIFESVEDSKYVVSYVTRKGADQVIVPAVPIRLEYEPAQMPAAFKVLCTDNTPCGIDEICDKGPCKSGSECRTEKEYKFGNCRS